MEEDNYSVHGLGPPGGDHTFTDAQDKNPRCTADDAAPERGATASGLPSDLVEDRARRVHEAAARSQTPWEKMGVEDTSTLQMSAAAGFCILLLGWQQLIFFALIWAGVAWYRSGYVPPKEVFIGVVAGAVLYSLLASALGWRVATNPNVHHLYVGPAQEWTCRQEGNDFVCRIGVVPGKVNTVPRGARNRRGRSNRFPPRARRPHG